MCSYWSIARYLCVFRFDCRANAISSSCQVPNTVITMSCAIVCNSLIVSYCVLIGKVRFLCVFRFDCRANAVSSSCQFRIHLRANEKRKKRRQIQRRNDQGQHARCPAGWLGFRLPLAEHLAHVFLKQGYDRSTAPRRAVPGSMRIGPMPLSHLCGV